MSGQILVIRGYGQFTARLIGSGHPVINLDLIRTEPVENLSDLRNKISRLDEYDGVFVTSPVAAEILVAELDRASRRFTGRTYVLGSRSKELLEDAGLNVVFRDAANTAEELIRSFESGEFADKRLLFIRGDRSMRTIPRLLDGVCRIEEVEVYRTVENPPDMAIRRSVGQQLSSGQIAWICFFSPSGVESFLRLFGREAVNRARVAVIGETTARPLQDEGIHVDLVSPKARSDEFAESLIERLKNFG